MRPPHLLLPLALLPAVTLATTIIPHTLAERAADSDRVALVQVLSQRVERSDSPQLPIKTITRVAVGDDVRGSGPAELEIVQAGGALGLERIEIPGDARFAVGETALVFLRCRLSTTRCHLVALGEGKLEVVGGDVLFRDLHTGKWVKRALAEVIASLRLPARPPAPAPGTAPAGVRR